MFLFKAFIFIPPLSISLYKFRSLFLKEDDSTIIEIGKFIIFSHDKVESNISDKSL